MPKTSDFLAGGSLRQSVESEESLCRPAHITTVFPVEGLRVVDIDGTRRQQQQEEAPQLVVCGVWRQLRVECAPTGYWFVQHGTNANDAKVFKAHAAPQGPM